ncbi:epididymal secretory protein 4-like [Heteronotia binoei]|uniref:epididymal secretory protein 4-like n=1 Tax=Heteronotia binoei TaxID=13085 RepID=UPI00292D3762|nr:epididymal secretory protein 4-like [Heteronotia binoei]
MKAALLIILLASVCLLPAGAEDTRIDDIQIPVFPNFDVQKVAGTWYRIANVLRNRDPMTVISFDDVLEPTAEGNLIFIMRYVEDEVCKTTKVEALHTNQPGIFTVSTSNETITMMEVDYESYYFVLVRGKNIYGMYLLSRTREASDDVRTKFKNLAVSLGFDGNQISDERLAETCEMIDIDLGKSEFGGMFQDCTTNIISIMVLQIALTAIF